MAVMMYMVRILIILCYPFVLSKLAHQQYNYNSSFLYKHSSTDIYALILSFLI